MYKVLAMQELANSPPINILMQVLHIIRADKSIQPRGFFFVLRLTLLTYGVHKIIQKMSMNALWKTGKESKSEGKETIQ